MRALACLLGGLTLALGCALPVDPEPFAEEDAGSPELDGGPVSDGGQRPDGGAVRDGGGALDGGSPQDGGSVPDGGSTQDGGAADGGAQDGGGAVRDGGTADGGAVDAGTTCPPPPAAPTLAIHTNGGQSFTTGGAWIALTGTAPAQVGGRTVEEVTVNGSARGVAFARGAATWSYRGPLEPGPNSFAVRARSQAGSAGPVSITVTFSGSPPPETAPGFGPGIHLVGAWMFTWFNGDPNWGCLSPWWPVAGYASWDGSVEWARAQLLDMMDANLDFVGLQYDTKDTTPPTGFRYTNVLNVVHAHRHLLEEGYRPPRLALFVDTAIVNTLYKERNGVDLDVSTAAGRAELFDYVRAYHDQVDAMLGDRYKGAAVATYAGRPMIAFWHTDTGSIVGASDAFVQDLKSRFQSQYSTTPYFIGHPNFWTRYPSAEEVTLMFGPPQHFYQGGRDGAGKPTINITPGFWNPISNPFYLPREAGARYDAAWATALSRRAQVDHLYIDSWNETGEGSGIFDAQTFQHADSYPGSCGNWVYRHADAWGPRTRHFIDVTAANAARWNDTPEDDAEVVAHDLPASLRRGERRYVTVVVRNSGDRPWRGADGDRMAVVEGGAWVPGGAAPIDDAQDEIPFYGGLFRGRPRPFTFEIVAPCNPTTMGVGFAMSRGALEFGDRVRQTIAVP
jgi:hypothetical protein